MDTYVRAVAKGLFGLVAVVVLHACGGGGGGDDGGGGAPPPAPPAPPAMAAPSGLSHASPQTYTVGTASGGDAHRHRHGVVVAVSPALPAGLAIDAATGAISGTPTAVAAQAVYTVTAANSAGSTTFALTLSALLERATGDRPDKAGKESTDQIHVLYVVPSDAGYDQQLDTTGKLDASVRSWNNWFGKQTGGPKLRLDTYGDADRLDVTFVQLTKSDADLAGTAGNVRTKLEYQLLAMGFDATNKVHLAYYEGDGDGFRRAAARGSPTLHGTVSVSLRGKANPDCPGGASLSARATTGLLGIPRSARGAAPARLRARVRAASSRRRRHRQYARLALLEHRARDNADDPRRQPRRLLTAAVPGCFDLMNSAYLDPAPAGPGGASATSVAVNLTPAACATELARTGADRHRRDDHVRQRLRARGTGAALSVAELVASGSGNVRTNVNSLPFGEGLTLNTTTNTKPKVGTVYVVTVGGIGGQCQAIVTATANPGRFVIPRDALGPRRSG
jgi:hypothetical protein